MAPIIPPGIGFILYGTVGQVSIGRLFAAGIIPGLLLWAALAVTISITARQRGYAPERETRSAMRHGGAFGRCCSPLSCCWGCASAYSRLRRSARSPSSMRSSSAFSPIAC